MANQEHLDILNQGVEVWNKWREEHEDINPDLSETELFEVDLCEVNLSRVNLNSASLGGAKLDKALLYEASLIGANLEQASLTGAFLWRAKLDKANLYGADLYCADLSFANLRGADLSFADLGASHLYSASLKEVSLYHVNFTGAFMRRADLERADLEGALLSDDKHIGPCMADVNWNGVNLTVVDWTTVEMLGDEYQARQQSTPDGKVRARAIIAYDYQIAVRAYSQLAIVLQAQGLNQDAARFAYKAQVLQRRVLLSQLEQWKWIEYVEDWVHTLPICKPILVLWEKVYVSRIWKQVATFGRQICRVGIQVRKIGAFLFSFLLDLLAGYGYRPGRTLFWYFFVVVSFSSAYAYFGHYPLFPDALVFSLTSFHGRGFFPGLGIETSLHNPLVVLAALEAVLGLFIEISFIATFTKRFFGT